LLEASSKQIEVSSRQNRLVLWGIFIISSAVLSIAAFLFYAGRDTVALTLLGSTVTLTATAFGAYGWGRYKQSRAPEEADE